MNGVVKYFVLNGKGGAERFLREGQERQARTVTIAPGTTFAYLMHTVKDWNKGKTQIEDMEDDSKGMN